MSHTTTFSEKDVINTAQLARIPLSKKEIKKLHGQLAEAIDATETLSELNTQSVSRTSSLNNLSNVSRPDVIDQKQRLSSKQALQNASSVHNNLFKVKAIFDHDTA